MVNNKNKIVGKGLSFGVFKNEKLIMMTGFI